MRINRSYALAATAWLVLVVVGAVLVWAVISRAGQGVVSQPGSPIGEAAPITSSPQTERPDPTKSAKPSKSRPSKSASASPGGQATSGPSGQQSPSSTPNAGPSPATQPSTGPGPAPGPGPGSGPTSSPNNPPSSNSPPPPQPSQPSQGQKGVRRTWQGSAGVVTVECHGATIELKGAQPNSGWSIEIDRRGPDEVRVDFDSGERRTRVQSECVGGTPQFEVDQGD